MNEQERAADNTTTIYLNNKRGLNPEQYDYLLKPLRSTRVANRSVGGKSLSYLEAWDVKAHLSRIFGFANWDLEMLESKYLGTHDYKSKDSKDMIEVAWYARMQLVVRDQHGTELARYCEGAVGSATGGAAGAGHGDLHDNALKQAASDATKRCAINLGTQFGLSLYDNGSKNDVVRQTLVRPEGVSATRQPSGDQAKNLEQGVGVTPSGDATNEGGVDPSTTEAQASDGSAADIAKEQQS